MKNNFSVEYLEDFAIYRVKLFREVSEATVKNCYKAYERLVEIHFNGNDFKLMINNSGYRPATERAHRLIRELFTNQTHKTKCIKVAVVNENVPLIEKRNGLWVNEVEGFFSNEEEAFKWLNNET